MSLDDAIRFICAGKCENPRNKVCLYTTQYKEVNCAYLERDKCVKRYSNHCVEAVVKYPVESLTNE